MYRCLNADNPHKGAVLPIGVACVATELSDLLFALDDRAHVGGEHWVVVAAAIARRTVCVIN